MNLKEEALRVLGLELEAVKNLESQLNESFFKAVDVILSCSSKVILTGMGKSGIVAQKISSTLSSTGTPSLFLHPAESSHGDLGVIQKSDIVVALSKSGEVKEMNELVNFVTRRGVTLIAITSNPESALARSAKLVLSTGPVKEACPLGLAPTSSTTASLVLGDILAMCLLRARGFKEKDFAEFHPGGALGRKMLTKVKDLMHSGDALPLVTKDMSLQDVVVAMTGGETRGVVGVVDKNKSLVGILSLIHI